MLRPRALVGAIAVGLALTGCGSTVQETAVPAGAGDQLGVPTVTPSAGALPPGTTPGVPGAPGSVPGTGSTVPGTVTRPGTTPAGGNGPGATLPPASQAKTGPLQLGVLDASSPAAAASATGANNPAGVDPVEVTRAFIRYYNDHGGMAGRKIQPIEYTINPTSSSYQNDLSAACAKFTQDNHVSVVVSQTGNIF